jgi:hypothetical protein
MSTLVLKISSPLSLSSSLADQGEEKGAAVNLPL